MFPEIHLNEGVT